jgi:hypothetical protein
VKIKRLKKLTIVIGNWFANIVLYGKVNQEKFGFAALKDGKIFLMIERI